MSELPRLPEPTPLPESGVRRVKYVFPTWIVAEGKGVNAFVMDGEPLPDPGDFPEGYSIAVGTDPDRRIRLEVRDLD